ncbi:MAG: hypothetical protein K9J30_04545 [Bacteroidales bacterium]|nr:hypothetical protein [Bacteroidales bacterium]
MARGQKPGEPASFWLQHLLFKCSFFPNPGPDFSPFTHRGKIPGWGFAPPSPTGGRAGVGGDR